MLFRSFQGEGHLIGGVHVEKLSLADCIASYYPLAEFSPEWDIITETVGVFNYAPTADFYAASRLLPQIRTARQGLSRVDEL